MGIFRWEDTEDENDSNDVMQNALRDIASLCGLTHWSCANEVVVAVRRMKLKLENEILLKEEARKSAEISVNHVRLQMLAEQRECNRLSSGLEQHKPGFGFGAGER